jgi:glycosyltransferase involved in cell wall biosynthesis
MERWIDATLDSVLAQDLPGVECIVVDDGSHDGTAARVAARADPRLRLLRQAQAGVSAARNAGLGMARAPAVLFLDADDMLHPTALSRLIAALDEEAVAAFGTVLRVDADGAAEPGQKPVAQHRHASGDMLEATVSGRRSFWNCGQVLIRTTVARAIGGFAPELRLSEDWEFLCRLAARGPCRFVGGEAEVLRHRVRADSTAPGLSTDPANHAPAIRAVFGNPALAARFRPRAWAALRAEVEAAASFEAGRQCFVLRRFDAARRLMLRGLRRPTARRVALFGLAEASRLLDRPLIGRLRFHAAPPA